MLLTATLLRVGSMRVGSMRVGSRLGPRAMRAAAAEKQVAVAGLAYDLETTGLDTSTSEIVQLAIVVVNSQKAGGVHYESLVLPNGGIDPAAARVHGFTREVLLERGARPFREVWAEVEDWIDTTIGPEHPLVWCAHNGDKFDKPILRRCIEQAEKEDASASSFASPRAVHLDSLSMARAALPKQKKHTLGALYELATNEALANAHDARVDCEALGLVWQWLVAQSDMLPAKGFQAHLQRAVYDPSPFERPPARRARRSWAGGAPRRAEVAAAKGGGGGGKAEDDLSLELTSLKGVGPYLAKRLHGKGLTSVSDLERAWDERGRNSKAMVGWLRRSLPGTSSLVLGRLVKGLKERSP